jgi:hypothetical protein
LLFICTQPERVLCTVSREGVTSVVGTHTLPDSYFRPEWNVDGKAVLFTGDWNGGQGLFQIEADGSNLQPLLIPGIESGWFVGGGRSPHGQHFAWKFQSVYDWPASACNASADGPASVCFLEGATRPGRPTEGGWPREQRWASGGFRGAGADHLQVPSDGMPWSDLRQTGRLPSSA